MFWLDFPLPTWRCHQPFLRSLLIILTVCLQPYQNPFSPALSSFLWSSGKQSLCQNRSIYVGVHLGLSSHDQEQGSRSCSLISQRSISPYHSASLS